MLFAGNIVTRIITYTTKRSEGALGLIVRKIMRKTVYI